MVAAVGRQPEEVEARGGEWIWGSAGPFPEGPDKVKFLIVAMDYFTKWIEAKPVATITGGQADRTMIKSSNGDTPFSLTYGTEAVIPAKIGMPTFRTAELDIAENDEALEINLDLIEEKREQAAIREAKSKRQMEKYYNTKVENKLQPRELSGIEQQASRVETQES
ncbi:hypothetical protein Tco_1113623 [Tanacetum coccineum]|uniref:Reverse transcriptase domain-containing protein n=1 Tax=Tanacetum coccineum TaxID=301880 RepID=A0ABQ5ISR8_9ASTR